HRTAAPEGNDVALANGAVFGGHVTGGKDISQKQRLLVGDTFRNSDGPRIGKRDPRILRLAARIAAECVGISEQSGAAEAIQLLCSGSIRIGVIAQGRHLIPAVEAISARDAE